MDPIERAIRSGQLKPADVGVRQFELRYYAQLDCTCRWAPADACEVPQHRCTGADDHRCDTVCVYFMDQGRVGSFMHCDRSITDVASDVLEGIGAEYLDETTVSYLSDDHKLSERIAAVLS